MSEEKMLVPPEFKERIVLDRRPWGNFTSYPLEGTGSVKIITVDPGGVLSLQLHERRDEYWVVLDEGLEVTVGERTWRPAPGEELWIQRGVKHRAKCIGDAPARFFELWLGWSDESDIVRLEDEYNRK